MPGLHSRLRSRSPPRKFLVLPAGEEVHLGLEDVELGAAAELQLAQARGFDADDDRDGEVVRGGSESVGVTTTELKTPRSRSACVAAVIRAVE